MDILHLLHTLQSLNWLEVLGAVNTLLAALIVIFALIPGEQPEKALRALAAFIGRFSRK
jgi:hypothetical protein